MSYTIQEENARGEWVAVGSWPAAREAAREALRLHRWAVGRGHVTPAGGPDCPRYRVIAPDGTIVDLEAVAEEWR